MKNTIQQVLLSAAVILITCSFTGSPVAEPAPFGGAYVVFAGKYGGEITQKELAGQRELGVDGCARGSRIFQFTLSVTKKGNTAVFTSKSNQLTAEMVNSLKSLAPGDEFEFSKMKAYLPNGKDITDVHGRKFVVKSGSTV